MRPGGSMATLRAAIRYLYSALVGVAKRISGPGAGPKLVVG
jgi:hypothetical protein